MHLINSSENVSRSLSSQENKDNEIKSFSLDKDKFSARISEFISFSSIDIHSIDCQVDFSVQSSIEFSFIYGIEENNNLIIQDVNKNTESEVLEKAAEEGLIGIKEKRGEKETIKLVKEIPKNIRSITYCNEEGVQTLDPTTVQLEVLTPEERKWVVAKIKAQIIYLRTLHPKGEKEEKTIKHLTNLLNLLEPKKDNDQDQDYKIRHKFSIQITSHIKTSIIRSISYSLEKTIQDRKEQDRQEAIDLKVRIIRIITIKSEINKEEIKKDETKKDQLKTFALVTNLKYHKTITRSI